MTWGGLAGSAVSGFATGAVMGAIAGLAVGDVSGAMVLGLAAGAGGGALHSVVQQGIDKGWSQIDGYEVMAGAAGGALGGFIGGGVGMLLNQAFGLAGRAAAISQMECGLTTWQVAQYAGLHAASGAIGGLAADTTLQSAQVAAGLQDRFNVMQAVGATVAGGLSSAAGYLGNYARYKVCFTAETPLRTPEGSRRIDEIAVGDWVLSRDENDPQGPVLAQRVEEKFVRTGQVWHLDVGGRRIRTTQEHPFYAEGKGWTALAELSVGDRLLGENGDWLTIEALENTGRYETVYNLKVSEFSTYFVGEAAWGFSVWAHNACDGTGPLTPEEQDFVNRLRQSHNNLHGEHEPLTNEQLDRAVGYLRQRSAQQATNTREYTDAEYRDFVGRLYAAARNEAHKKGEVATLPPEFDQLKDRTRSRIQTEAAQYMDPDLLHLNSNDHNQPVILYRLVKDGDGHFEYGGQTHYAQDGEIVHYGTTAKYRIPEGADWRQAVLSRYDGPEMVGLRLEMVAAPTSQRSQLGYQRALIRSYELLNGARPVANTSNAYR